MRLAGVECGLRRLGAPLAIWHGEVSPQEWAAAVRAVGETDARLVSLWGSDRRRARGCFLVSVAYALPAGLLWLSLPVDAAAPRYPNLSSTFPCAARMQRAAFDMLGVVAEGAPDTRNWLRHGAWPADYFPLRQDFDGSECFETAADSYPFVAVEGDGVHEIPVGPVHAGIIEPGHFRFSVVGEKILRLEERLGYKHKGIEKRFERMPLLDGYRLAGRVSGDSTVAYAWAYCMAVESLAGCVVPRRAVWLRALMLERERVANHLGDLGALGNDAALAFGLAQFSRLKEDWLRLNDEAFGHRFIMDRIVPGGVAIDIDAGVCSRMARQCDRIEREVLTLKGIYDEHAGLQDRFVTTGRVSTQLASRLGLCGLAGRASGLASDLRVDHAWSPYDELDPRMATHRDGDVAARVTVRFEETTESLRLIREIAARLPQGSCLGGVTAPTPGTVGAGRIEGWRGEVMVAIELDESGALRRCHCHDPSWHNWPVLEHAVIGNIVPDFPLINKSFNLTYSGQDL